MSENIYEPGAGDENDVHVIDVDLAFGDEAERVLDTSFSPPEKPRELNAYGITVDEQRHGETLEQRLAQEEPDPTLLPLPDDDPDWQDDSEAGAVRAGRLVAPDAGSGFDDEAEMIALDVGIDGAAASAEEAAMHIVVPR